jgi:hypothetical protein
MAKGKGTEGILSYKTAAKLKAGVPGNELL